MNWTNSPGDLFPDWDGETDIPVYQDVRAETELDQIIQSARDRADA
jgi:hypothetical protein